MSKTKMHPQDVYNNRRQPQRDYTWYICGVDGSPVMPSLEHDNLGFCPHCNKLVPLCGIPATFLSDVMAEYRRDSLEVKR